MTEYKNRVVIEWNETETGVDLHQVVDINGSTLAGLLTAFAGTYEDIMKDNEPDTQEEEPDADTDTN